MKEAAYSEIDGSSQLGEKKLTLPAGRGSSQSSWQTGCGRRTEQLSGYFWVRRFGRVTDEVVFSSCAQNKGTHPPGSSPQCLGWSSGSKKKHTRTVYHGNRIKCYLKAISQNCFQYINILVNDQFILITSLTLITIFLQAVASPRRLQGGTNSIPGTLTLLLGKTNHYLSIQWLQERSQSRVGGRVGAGQGDKEQRIVSI